jgi:hypothetical protein
MFVVLWYLCVVVEVECIGSWATLIIVMKEDSWAIMMLVMIMLIAGLSGCCND